MSNQQHAAERDPKWFFAAAAVALAMLVASALVAGELAAGMFRSWNDVRLAPSAGWLHGYELYYAPGESGPIWSWNDVLQQWVLVSPGMWNDKITTLDVVLVGPSGRGLRMAADLVYGGTSFVRNVDLRV